MQIHVSLAYLEAEANALDLEASRIEEALRFGRPSAAEAEACIRRANQRLRALQDIEDHTIGAVLREHMASVRATPLAAEANALEEARGDRHRLRQDLERGSDCRQDLETYARHLHEAAAIERNQVAPWARQALGEALLREADARMLRHGRSEPHVAVDWDRFTG